MSRRRKHDRKQGGKSGAARVAARRSVLRGSRRPPALLIIAGVVTAVVLLTGYGVVRWRGGGRSGASDVAPAGAAIPRVEDLDALDPAVAEAIRAAVARVERAPSKSEAWGELGIVYHAHRYFALAARSYAEAARLDPATPDWTHLLGVLAEERGDALAAAAYYRAELERAPAHAAARYRLGSVLLQAGSVDEAARAFDQLASSLPGEPWGELGLGRVALRRGRPVDAAQHFERALALDPGNAQLAYLLASAYREQGNQVAAQRLAEPARDGVRPAWPADPILDRVRTGVRSLQSMVAAANQMLAAGDAGAAEALYATVLGSDPDHYDALYNLGMLYGRQGRFAEAQPILERAVAARPRSSQARMLLALALASQDRLDAARDELRALLEVDPQHAVATRMLEDLER